MGRTATLAALLLIAALIGCALAQAPAPAPSIFDDPCYDVVFENLFDCADYVNPKNSSTPSLRGACCQGVGKFLRVSPQCICYLIKTDLSELFGGIDIDRGKALNLPNVCKKKLPIAEFSKCSGNGTSAAVSSKCLEPVAEKLIPCVDYVDPSSNKTKPPANGACCSGLKGFLRDNSSCLCSLVNVKPGDFPIPIDRTKILQLPGYCSTTIPSFKCSGNVTLPAPENKCLMPLVNKLGSCVDFVDPTVNGTKPPSKGSCCSGLKGFLKDDFNCLCSIINVKPGDYPVSIDRSRILQLPGICNATIPSFKCSGSQTVPAPENKCLMPLVNKLGSCVDFVDPTVNGTKPPSKGSCCSGLKGFLKDDFNCLCSIINVKPGDYPVSIDRSRILQLPDICNATIPSFKCSGNQTVPAPENKCLMPLVNKLGSCVDFVDPTVNGTKPPSKGSCCSGLKGFLKDDFNCLCSIINVKQGDYPVSIDRSRILQLPGICNATIPSFKCSSGETLPAAENKCLTPVVSKLGSCIDYVDPTNSSSSSKPSLKGDCCGGVKSFLNENFDCLCSLINIKPEDYPLPIDRSKVLTLPGSCNTTIPSLTCNGTVTSRAPENSCLMPAVNNLAQCVDYVDPTSNISDGMPVSPECCSGARNFVKTNPLCICPIISGKTDAYPIPIDKSKAFTVVNNCSVVFKPQDCLPSGGPNGAPGNDKASARRTALISSVALFGAFVLSFACAFF